MRTFVVADIVRKNIVTHAHANSYTTIWSLKMCALLAFCVIVLVEKTNSTRMIIHIVSELANGSFILQYYSLTLMTSPQGKEGYRPTVGSNLIIHG